MNIVTPKEMAAYDKRTIELGTPSLELMERAGQACTSIIEDVVEKDKKILIVCGSGNNGGDGEVIARLLAQNDYSVSILFTAAQDILRDKMSKESLHNYLRLENLNINLYYAATPEVFDKIIPKFNVVVDCVFGTGLDDRPMSPYYQELFSAINESDNFIIAIDIPSGLNGTNGRFHSSVKADLTIMIQNPKTGEFLEDGPDRVGEYEIVDIGIETDAPILDQDENKKKLLLKENLKFPIRRKKNSHKYHYGRVLILAGSKGMLGAAALASAGALRSGAGLVTNYVPERIYSAAVSLMPPEALVESYQGIVSLDTFEGIKRDVILFGPGIGRRNDYSGLLSELMKGNTPVIIDADGLWMMHRDLDIFKESKVPVTITPHHGEFAALLDISLDELKRDPIHYASLFAQDYQVVVVLKSYHTLVCGPNGEIWFNTTGNPGMATPGSGDVLAGMTAAITAQLGDNLEAAKAAVFYHGLAGDYYAEHYNETTLLATDIIDSLKYVLK